MSDININIRIVSKAAEAALNSFGSAAKGAEKRLTLFEKATRQVNRSIDSFVGNLGANLAFRAFNGVIRGLAATVDNVRAFETALVGVGKTTGLAGKELEALGQQVENLSKDIPVASTELLDLAKTAAQLGVTGTDNILKFTETMARLATATDIVGESGAIAFARIINVTGENVQSVDRLGASIVALGNNFAATESQILAVSNEVARGGARFGLTAEQTLGLSAAMASLGVQAQIAGSTTQKVFSNVEKAIGKGGTELKKFTDVLGLNRKEFINLFKTNPQKFFVELIGGLKRTKDSGQDLSTALAELGFADLRVTKTLGPLIDRHDELTRAVDLSSQAYKDNTALVDESEAAFKTLDSDLQKLENSFVAMTNTILRALVPAIKATVQGLTSIIEFVQDSDFVISLLIAGATVLAAKLVLVTAGLISTAASTIAFNFALITATGSAATFWLTLLGPIGLAIIGITALVFAYRKLVGDTEEATATQSGYNTVLAAGNVELDKRNKAIQTQIDLQTGLQGLLVPQDSGINSVIDPNAEARASAADKARENEAEARRQDDTKRLEELNTFGTLELEKKLEIKRAQLLAEDELTAEDRENKLSTQRTFLENELNVEKISLEKKLNNEEASRKLQLKNDTANLKAANIIKDKARKEDLKSQDEFLSLAAGLQTSGNKTFAAIGKAAALTQLAIKTPEAVGNAYAFGSKFGPITGAIFAGIASAAMGVQAAKIAGLSFQDGGVVPGQSFSGDNVQANVNSGEMILNRQQQSTLFEQANGGGSSGGSGGDTVVMIDGEEVFRAVSRQVANGAVLGEGGV